jgi:hypothetical protein
VNGWRWRLGDPCTPLWALVILVAALLVVVAL